MLRHIFILLMLLIVFYLPGECCAEEFALVVNKENPITALDQSTIKKIFLGKKTFWDDGHSIEVFLQGDKSLHKTFTSKVLNKSVRQFKIYWRRELYSGTGLPPQELADDQQIKAAIAATPRAISYINKDSLDDSVKALEINFE